MLAVIIPINPRSWMEPKLCTVAGASPQGPRDLAPEAKQSETRRRAHAAGSRGPGTRTVKNKKQIKKVVASRAGLFLWGSQAYQLAVWGLLGISSPTSRSHRMFYEPMGGP